jgi:hypothetical protein
VDKNNKLFKKLNLKNCKFKKIYIYYLLFEKSKEVYRLGDAEKRDKQRQKWLSSPAMVKWYRDGGIVFKKSVGLTKEVSNEDDDVYVYKTVRYPPNSNPPTTS